MIVRGVVLLALLLGGLFAPSASAVPASDATSWPLVMAQPATRTLSVQAAKKKPRAALTASAVVLASGKVRVSVTSNAKKVKLSYRTAKNKKRTATIKIRKGAGAKTLANGSKQIYARARATKALRTSPYVRVTPTGAPGGGATGALTRVDIENGHAVACASDLGTAIPWTSDCERPFYWPGSMPNTSAWSPDGTKIAFSECYSQGGDCLVFVKDLVTGGVTHVSTAVDGASGSAGSGPGPVAWSPDGTQIAFEFMPGGAGVGLVPGANNRDILLYVKTLSTGAIVWHPHTVEGYAEVPYFGPYYGGGTEPWRLSEEAASAYDVPEWDARLSPDGGRVVSWTHTRRAPADTDKYPDVYVRDLHTGTVTLVSTKADGTKLFESSYPSWSPDGKRVLFASYGTDSTGLYIKELN